MHQLPLGCKNQDLDASIGLGRLTLDKPLGAQPVAEACHVGRVAAQPASEVAHRQGAGRQLAQHSGLNWREVELLTSRGEVPPHQLVQAEELLDECMYSHQLVVVHVSMVLVWDNS
jgi:hypothetical protein